MLHGVTKIKWRTICLHLEGYLLASAFGHENRYFFLFGNIVFDISNTNYCEHHVKYFRTNNNVLHTENIAFRFSIDTL